MTSRRGRTKWLTPAEKAQQEAVHQHHCVELLQQLHAICDGQFDDGIIEMVAEQSAYDFDVAMQSLQRMTDPARPRSRVTTSTSDRSSGSGGGGGGSALPSSSAWSKSRGTQSSAASPAPIVSNSAAWPSLTPTSAAVAARSKPSTSQTGRPARSSIATSRSSNNSSASLPSSPHSSSSQSSASLVSAPGSPSPVGTTQLQRFLSSSSTDTNNSSNDDTARSPSLTSTTINADRTTDRVRVLDRDSDSFSISELPLKESKHSLFNHQYKPEWTTYNHGVKEPLYYLNFVQEFVESQRNQQQDAQLAEQLQRELNVSSQPRNETFPVLKNEPVPAPASVPSPSVRAASTKPAASVSNVLDHSALTELLSLMFDRLDRSLIESVVKSLDGDTATIDTVNECVNTLITITAEDQLNDDDAIDVDTNANVDNINVGGSAASKRSMTSKDQKFELTDLEIAQRMATDPSYSPPRAAATRTLAQSQSQSNARMKFRAIKLDYSRPIYRWAPQTNIEQHANPSLGATWKLTAIKRAFPSLDAELIEDTFAANNYHFDNTMEHLKQLFPDELMVHNPTIIDSSNGSNESQAVSPRSSARSLDDVDSDVEYEGEYLIDDATLERELGLTLDNRTHHEPERHTVSRHSVSQHAKRRAAYFRAATAAFFASKGAQAKEFAELGKQESSMMMQSSIATSAAIFRSHNKPLDNHRTIDLHGLHAKESVCFLHFVIRRLHRRGVGSIVAVTGVGRNSVNGRSRLKPAIQRYCERHWFKWNTVSPAEIRIVFG